MTKGPYHATGSLIGWPRTPVKDEHLEAAGAGVLVVIGFDGDGAAGAEDGRVSGGYGPALSADTTAASED
jgi:hypothetical protein